MIKYSIIILLMFSCDIFGQTNDKYYIELIAKADSLVSAGDIAGANYYITRYIGLILIDSTTGMKTGDINKVIDKLNIKPTSFISGKYSQDFLKWFFLSTYYMWAANEDNTNENNYCSLITQTINDKYYTAIIGSPVIKYWSILGASDGQITRSYIHLIDHKSPPLLVFQNLSSKKVIYYYLKDLGLYYQHFWQPEFIDFKGEGTPNIILRYNVVRADGFFQECDILAIKDTSLILIDSLVGDPEGFAIHTTGNSFKVGYESPSTRELSHLSYDKYKIKTYNFVNDKFKEAGGEETIQNILWTDKFKEYFFDE